ncbi:hypothetical protein KTH90_16625 [Lachnospiraceae bacterium ASD4241]|uniref:Uncharacterized protein n=2 Tax=Diplocloster modestus TaxID=2850322 RepID=A0ABS6KAU7_9FIRM|nr:hypothetical protein [Diplocloster modestus]
MDSRNLEKAMDIISSLLINEEIHRDRGANRGLYEEYLSNAEVYDMVHLMAGKMNLCLYEYQGGIYVSAGEGNRVYGYSNEELKRVLGLRLNRELYLCYFLIYQVVATFYHDSASDTFIEYMGVEELIHNTDSAFAKLTTDLEILVLKEMEENSFKTLALLWEELPLVTGEEGTSIRASRNSKKGYSKLVFNFLVSQELLAEAEERYYPTARFKALITNYYEEHQGRLYEILNQEEEKDDAADQPDPGE